MYHSITHIFCYYFKYFVVVKLDFCIHFPSYRAGGTDTTCMVFVYIQYCTVYTWWKWVMNWSQAIQNSPSGALVWPTHSVFSPQGFRTSTLSSSEPVRV